jgi:hypothetical protein
MEHPLIGDISELDADELNTKITELHKKLSIAYRLGNQVLCNQIQMALETYQNKYQEKLKKNQTDTGFDGMINIS